ncbi:hypothetical protein FRC14_005566 [Serendipita sp. 396]|nr:hypothetical protein FRC14_005566 [Serendipita sp. 396]KAG8789257.1 hypothetical protein FRC15_010093 [Serendipita sp. 397]KAG8804475.1 hypothetical protein FRC16_007884 [Serendipita sp. 398]KAG8827560.1 hypothetical protein FRC19_002253 [Serendipita sp. 401]KAG8878435.1 hypothetical protein FRC20_008358 [Serendipita sp. 405]KAG9057959.1 hypothetical protein FS842_002651 [Serendipita sp. 407]
MQAFLNRLRSQSTQQKQNNPLISSPIAEQPISSPNTTETASPDAAAAPIFSGVRKIHPNQEELLTSSASTLPPPSASRRASTNELGVRVPSARVANRNRTSSISQPKEDTIRESNESEHDQPDAKPVIPEPTLLPKSNLSLFSAVPFSTGGGWSTFGRSKKEKENIAPQLSDDRAAINRGSATVSRTSSRSRTTTTATRTPPPKHTALSRSNSARQRTSTEQLVYSRVPLGNNDSHDNSPPDLNDRIPPSQQQQENTPSTPSAQQISVLNQSPSTPDHKDATYPPRTTVMKSEGPVSASSLPFTFGRQAPARPVAETLFVSEFGTPSVDQLIQDERSTEVDPHPKDQSGSGGQQQPENDIQSSAHSHSPSRPFPSLETSSPAPSPHVSAQPRLHLSSDSSVEQYTNIGSPTGTRHTVPSLVSDDSNEVTHKDDFASTPGTAWSLDFPFPNRASFGPSGDEVSNLTKRSSPLAGSHDKRSSRAMNDERRRHRSISSTSSGAKALPRRSSFGRQLVEVKEQKQLVDVLPGIRPPSPVIVMSTGSSNLQKFPSQEDMPPIASTSAHAHQDTSATAVDPEEQNESQVPNVAVTGPTPRPSPMSAVPNRLSQLFEMRSPDGYAHASGIGVAGVETHTRKSSLKVMGKRKATDGDESDEIVVQDQRGYRPRFDSNAPSSYHRKRMKLSSNASERDVFPLRTSNSASRSGAPSVHSVGSSRPGTGAGKGSTSHRGMHHNASAVSIPVSAILTPRAPSVSMSAASKRHSGMRYQHPLKNRVQRRRRSEAWADSWILDRDEMPIQAWLFLMGFFMPLCWWAALFIPIRRRGRSGEKAPAPSLGVMERSNSGLWTDPTEFDEVQARLWRKRCLIATVVSTVIYVPIIVCAVVFSRR